MRLAAPSPPSRHVEQFVEHLEQLGILVVDEALADALDDGNARQGWWLELRRRDGVPGLAEELETCA